MKRILHHKGKYTASEFTVDEIVLSLSAQKELIETAIEFLTNIDSDLTVDSVKVRINSLSTGSFLWDLIVEIHGKYQEEFDPKVIDGLENFFGTDIPDGLEPLVTLAVLALAYWVARFAYDRVSRAKDNRTPSIHISGESNIVIQQIADTINCQPEVINSALERTLPIPKRRKLVGKVADFLRPSRKDDNAVIELDGARTITNEVLKEFPNDADLNSLDERFNIDLVDARIDIRATDRDRTKSGWSAAILNDERFQGRLPMDLYPTVDTGQLADHRTVIANLVVECENDSVGQMKPKRIHLISFEKNQ
ncbi:MAG: hypothetical protein AAGF58_00825 [Pseudomonadota bacterium]